MADLRGKTEDVIGSRCVSEDRGVRVQLSIAAPLPAGFDVLLNDPKLARYAASLFLTAASILEAKS